MRSTHVCVYTYVASVCAEREEREERGEPREPREPREKRGEKRGESGSRERKSESAAGTIENIRRTHDMASLIIY